MTIEEAAPLVEVRRGAPTPEELAAVVAVVSDAYEREAATQVIDEATTTDAWKISARSPRQPLRRELGWRNFSA